MKNLLKLLVLVLIYFLGIGLSFAKPNLEGGAIFTRFMCEHYTKVTFVCTVVHKDEKRYIVVEGWNGQHEIYELIKGKYELVWSRRQT